MIRPLVIAAQILLPVTVLAADGARDALLASYATQAKKVDPFAAFSAQRGETLFRTKWAKGDERTPSCTSCHTDNPRNPGQNAKTGRAIEPVAVSAIRT